MLEVVCPNCRVRVNVPPELVGRLATCSACGRPFQTQAVPSSPTAGDASGSGGASATVESVGDRNAASGTTSSQRSGKQSYGCVVVCILLLFAAIGGITWFNPLRPEDATDGDSPILIVEYEDVTVDPTAREISWSTRDDVWLVLNRRKVRIAKVELAPIHTKDGRGIVSISGRRFLQVFVRVMNATNDTPSYTSWYQIPGRGQREVTLEDNRGQIYPLATLQDVHRIKGHTPRAEMKPLEPINDVLIFEVPEGFRLLNVDYFRLSLPATAWGEEGEFHFQIPHARINSY